MPELEGQQPAIPEPLQPTQLPTKPVHYAPTQPSNESGNYEPTEPPLLPPPPPPPLGPKRKPYVLIASLVALLLIIIPVVGLVINNTISTNNNNATATAGSQTARTATARVRIRQATASAITATVRFRETATAGPIATARAHEIATEGPIIKATGGTSAYADRLNNRNNIPTQEARWDGLDGSDTQCVFASDGYHVIQNTDEHNLHACKEVAYQVKNVTIIVDVKLLYGDSGGIFLRFSTGIFGNYSGYMFEVDSHSRYKFSNFGGDTLKDWTFSPILKAGTNVNTLKMIIKGNMFALYANNGYLTTVTDNSSSEHSSGNIALFASAPADNTEVVFSNLAVWQMS